MNAVTDVYMAYLFIGVITILTAVIGIIKTLTHRKLKVSGFVKKLTKKDIAYIVFCCICIVGVIVLLSILFDKVVLGL